MSVIQTSREAFGDIADLNYELMLKDVSNMNLQYQAPTISHQIYISQLLGTNSTHRNPHDFHGDFLA